MEATAASRSIQEEATAEEWRGKVSALREPAPAPGGLKLHLGSHKSLAKPFTEEELKLHDTQNTKAASTSPELIPSQARRQPPTVRRREAPDDMRQALLQA